MNQLAFENGHAVESQEFDYDAVEFDRSNPLTAELSEATQNQSSDITTLGKVFGLLLTYGGTDSSQFFITANVLAFVMGLHPNQGSGGVVIASGLGMEKQTFFRRVNQMRNILKMRGAVLPKIVGEWSREARSTIKQVTTKHHERRKSINNIGTEKSIAERFGSAIKGAGIGN